MEFSARQTRITRGSNFIVPEQREAFPVGMEAITYIRRQNEHFQPLKVVKGVGFKPVIFRFRALLFL